MASKGLQPHNIQLYSQEAHHIRWKHQSTVILEKFTSQNFQFKIIQPKKFLSLKVIHENFYG